MVQGVLFIRPDEPGQLPRLGSFSSKLKYTVFVITLGNGQSIHTIFTDSSLRQITGRKQYTPHIVDTGIDFIIRQFQPDSLFDGVPCNQLFHFFFCSRIRLINKTFYKIIAACWFIIKTDPRSTGKSSPL